MLNAFWYAKNIPTIPPGLIIPFLSNDPIPEGWVVAPEFNDDSYPVGCRRVDTGGVITYDAVYGIPGNNGGDQYVVIETNFAGQHPSAGPPIFDYRWNTDMGSGAGNTSSVDDRGGGSHLLSVFTEPSFVKFRFIKAAVEVPKLPKNGVCLSAEFPLEHLNKLLFANKLLKGCIDYNVSSPPDYIEEDETSYVSGQSVVGYHDHVGTYDAGDGSVSDGGSFTGTAVTSGGHGNHPIISLDVVNTISTANMTAYTDSTDDYILTEGVYAMWMEDTPPDGWVIADGSNDTIDMRGRFVVLSDDDTLPNSSAAVESYIQISASLGSAGQHAHIGGYGQGAPWRALCPHDVGGDHTHTAFYYDTYNPVFTSVNYIKFIG